MRKSKIDFELVECIINTKADLNVANKNFEQAEGDLIDYYSYQIKANKAKLDYLIKGKKEGTTRVTYCYKKVYDVFVI